jgi:Immunity protein Imm5
MTSDVVQLALHHLANARDGHLPLGFRQALWATLGPRGASDGRKRRAELATRCMRYAEPLWRGKEQEVFVLRCLESARIAASLPPSTSVEKAVTEAWIAVIDLNGEHPALIAAAAAAKVLTTSVFDEPFDEHDLDLTRGDVDDFDCGDAAFFVAWLFAGGHPLDPSDTEARRAFWHWWLLQAIPLAGASDLNQPEPLAGSSPVTPEP